MLQYAIVVFVSHASDRSSLTGITTNRSSLSAPPGAERFSAPDGDEDAACWEANPPCFVVRIHAPLRPIAVIELWCGCTTSATSRVVVLGRALRSVAQHKTRTAHFKQATCTQKGAWRGIGPPSHTLLQYTSATPKVVGRGWPHRPGRGS